MNRSRGRGNRGERGRGRFKGNDSFNIQPKTKPEDQKFKPKTEMSPITGVEMLYPTITGRKTNLAKVIKTFAEIQQSELGKHAEYLTNRDVTEEEDNIPDVTFDEVELIKDIGHFNRNRIQGEMDDVRKDRAKRKDARFKLWSRQMSILSIESKHKVENWPGYDIAYSNKTEISGARILWGIIIESHSVGDVYQDDDQINFDILEEYNSICMNGEKEHISEYYENITHMLNTLEFRGIPIPDEPMQAYRFLKGLPRGYDTWKRNYREMGGMPFQTLQAAYAAASIVRPTTTTSMKKSYGVRGRGNRGGGRMAFATTSDVKSEERSCFICEKQGHLQADCPLIGIARQLAEKDGYLVMKPNSDRKPSGNAKKADTETSVRDGTSGGRRGGRRGGFTRGRGRNRGRIAAVTNGREYYDEEDDYRQEYFDDDEENYDEDDYEEDEDEYDTNNDYGHKAFVTIALAATSADENNLVDSDVLLDSQANLSVFWNRNMLLNIVKAKYPMPYAGQTAEKDVKLTHYGEFMGIPKIWLDERGKANILSYHLAEAHLVSNNRGYINQVKQNGVTMGWDLVVDNNTLAFRMKMGGLHACNIR